MKSLLITLTVVFVFVAIDACGSETPAGEAAFQALRAGNAGELFPVSPVPVTSAPADLPAASTPAGPRLHMTKITVFGVQLRSVEPLSEVIVDTLSNDKDISVRLESESYRFVRHLPRGAPSFWSKQVAEIDCGKLASAMALKGVSAKSAEMNLIKAKQHLVSLKEESLVRRVLLADSEKLRSNNDAVRSSEEALLIKFRLGLESVGPTYVLTVDTIRLYAIMRAQDRDAEGRLHTAFELAAFSQAGDLLWHGGFVCWRPTLPLYGLGLLRSILVFEGG